MSTTMLVPIKFNKRFQLSSLICYLVAYQNIKQTIYYKSKRLASTKESTSANWF